MRNAVAEFVGAYDADAGVRVSQALSEALTNVVQHAYRDRAQPGAMCVTAWVKDSALVVEIEDDGDGMAPRPDSPGLGLGLPLIAQFADDFRVADRPEGGTRMAMKFSLRATR